MSLKIVYDGRSFSVELLEQVREREIARELRELEYREDNLRRHQKAETKGVKRLPEKLFCIKRDRRNLTAELDGKVVDGVVT